MYLIKPVTLVIILAISLVSTASFAEDLSKQAIAQRIAPVGNVYLHGDIATASQTADVIVASGPRSGEKVYNTYCVACHATGAAGAPLKGDALAWKPRVDQGMETLVKHATEGFNAMPARGTCADCSDEEIAATVKFLTAGIN
ncbi:c-type cytochrome [Psychromonas antarctica]|uniref:c-type cytochrome n=1 Tax=Psychromonas antarctica TaxID=67573 RepID=UPI001EE78809|nr:cytochrome c5 family protein [Psychromonas antarctica]